MSRSAEHLIRQHRYSVREYHRMGEARIFHEDDRVELVQEVIVDVTPIGSRHAAAVARLYRLLNRAVADEAIVWVRNPIALGEDSEPQPDLALLRPRDDFYSRSLPEPSDVLLVVEVADTSLRYDRDVKIPLYARHGIPEAWLIDLEADSFTIHREPGADGYRAAASPEDTREVVVAGVPGITADLSDLMPQ